MGASADSQNFRRVLLRVGLKRVLDRCGRYARAIKDELVGRVAGWRLTIRMAMRAAASI
jgi:hypothetical protein